MARCSPRHANRNSNRFSAIAIRPPTSRKSHGDFTSEIASGCCVDVEYRPAALEPPLSPITGDQLDMSLCFLRSISPIHVQYLKNMGVRATLVVSLLVNGKLWGLVSCHHYVPRFIHFEERAVCELLAEAAATRIAALESFGRAQAEYSVRRLEQRMIRAISLEGDWRGALFDQSKALLEPPRCHRRGAAVRR